MSSAGWQGLLAGLGSLSQSTPGVISAFQKEKDEAKALKLQSDWANITANMPVEAEQPAPEVVNPVQSIGSMAPAAAQTPGGSAVGAIAAPAGPSSFEEALPFLKKAIAQKESGGGKNVNHMAYNKDGKTVIGQYGIDPWTWFPSIGLDPNKKTDREKFSQDAGLQDKAVEVVLKDAWERSGGDPRKIAAIYYGGPRAADMVGTTRGDRKQVAYKMGPDSIPQGIVPMPSVNTDADRFMSALRETGLDPESMRASTVAAIPDDAESALQQILSAGMPKAPKVTKKVGGYGDKVRYLVEAARKNPLLADKAMKMVADLSKLAENEGSQDKLAMENYNKDADRFTRAAIADASNRATKKTASNSKEATQKLNAKKAEMLAISKQLGDIDALGKTKWDKVSDQQKSYYQGRFKNFFKKQTAKQSPWGAMWNATPGIETVMDTEALAKHAGKLSNRYQQLQSEIAEMGGSEYSPDMPSGASVPSDFFMDQE